jgi:zinc/manganese transport system substrate-binding protein
MTLFARKDAMITRRRLVTAALLAGLGPAGAGGARAQVPKNPDVPKLKVLATFSILADIVKNVGGERVDVATLVGPNGDAHVYEPAPADARKVADAKVVFVNGLGFEGWMSRLVKASGTKATVVVASAGVTPRKLQENGQSEIDPHAWQSVDNVKVYVANVRDALIAADPAGKPDYQANATAYLGRLDALDREVRAALAAIAPGRRKLISTHDAFGYFAEAYGIDLIAPQGVSTDAEPSARDVARIVTQIKMQNIPAVFLENIADPRLMRQIAQESGARIGGTLYSDALTEPNGAAPTYIALVRHNIEQIAAALAG